MILEDLKEEYHNYKKKKYRFGRYGTSKQIQNEFSKGKTFVLKGGLRGLEWNCIILFFLLGSAIPIFTLVLVAIPYEVGIFSFFVFVPIGLIFFLGLRNLLVIGPSGVYYRKILSSGSFSWNSVANIEGFIRTTLSSIFGTVTSLVVVKLSSGAKIRFQSRTYSNKEFFKYPEHLEGEMFLKLFNIYFKLGRKQQEIKLLEDAISKAPEGSRKDKMIELKKKLQVKTKMEETEKNLLEEMVKNLLEEKLLRRAPERSRIQSSQDKKGSDRDREIKRMEDPTLKTPKGRQKIRMNELKENIQLISKFSDKSGKRVIILEEIMKNDEEYKILLERKSAGEPVEDLIKKNRNYAEVLAKKNKESSEEAIKWGKSEEATNVFRLLEETLRMDPDFVRDSKIRLERGLRIAKEIKKNDEEFEKLLERKNKGEYVDDLIKQNRYTAKVLDEQNKKVWD